MTRFIIPNFHVILIHFPLGLLGAGLLIEIFSFLWRRSSFRDAGRWMILLGTLAMLPAATSGAFALLDVMSQGGDASSSWFQLKANSGFSAHDWELAKDHFILTGAATLLALLAVLAWMSASDRSRRRVYPAALIALIAAMGMMIAGAWHGGEMIYRQGFGVDGKKSVEADATPNPHPSWRDKIEAYAPAGQVHVILAGVLFAFAAGSLGASLRRSKLYEKAWIIDRPVQSAAKSLSAPSPMIADQDPTTIPLMGTIRTESYSADVQNQHPPTARFWMLALLVGLLAATSGLYFGGFLTGPHVVDWPRLRSVIRDIRSPDNTRMGAHIILGLSTIVLVFFLAIFARWAPRSRFLIGFTALLLLLVIAAQTWMGILLLFDGGGGPLTRFQPAEVSAQQSAPAVPIPATVPSTQPATMPR